MLYKPDLIFLSGGVCPTIRPLSMNTEYYVSFSWIYIFVTFLMILSSDAGYIYLTKLNVTFLTYYILAANVSCDRGKKRDPEECFTFSVRINESVKVLF